MGDCEQDKKWWNGIITDYNGLSKEHWWAPLHPCCWWLPHPFRPVVCQQGARRSCSTVPTIQLRGGCTEVTLFRLACMAGYFLWRRLSERA